MGATPILEKLARRGASPLIVLPIRAASVATCLFTFLSALTGSVLGLPAFPYALQRNQASPAIPLTSAYPLVMVVLIALVLDKAASFTKVLGAAVIAAGVMLPA